MFLAASERTLKSPLFFIFVIAPLTKIKSMLSPPLFLNIQLEATVVGIVTIVFLALFIVAGIRQKLKDRDE